jgi:hypothetical protein
MWFSFQTPTRFRFSPVVRLNFFRKAAQTDKKQVKKGYLPKNGAKVGRSTHHKQGRKVRLCALQNIVFVIRPKNGP